MPILCGFPQPGCDLCKKYGRGWGDLLKEYASKPVTITTEIDGKTKTVTYTPPKYKCTTCEDKKVAFTTLWIPELVDEGCSDNGEHNMPKVKVACHSCCREQFEKERADAKKRYYDDEKKKKA